jgi:hypothetical protein
MTSFLCIAVCFGKQEHKEARLSKESGWIEEMAQMVECLLSKLQTLGSIPSTGKKKKTTTKQKVRKPKTSCQS